MAIRKNREMGFADAMIGGGRRTVALLERLDAATPWRELAAPIYGLPEYTHTGPGRPPWDPTLMIKCLMLSEWFNLSDPGLEEALQDRISFRRFVGLSFADETPDETTFVRFRERLREAGLHDHVFDAVVARPTAAGWAGSAGRSSGRSTGCATSGACGCATTDGPTSTRGS